MPKERVEEAPPTVLVTLATEVVTLKETVEVQEEYLKELKEDLEAAEKKLVDEMVTQQVRSFRHGTLGGFRTEAVVYPNVKDKETFYKYLEMHDMEWMFTKSVNGTKLRSFVKELMQEGKDIPPGVDPYTTTVIRRFK